MTARLLNVIFCKMAEFPFFFLGGLNSWWEFLLVFLERHDMVEFPAYEGGSGKAPWMSCEDVRPWQRKRCGAWN